MIERILQIVRKFGGYQLASDEGVFRFRTVKGCCDAIAEIGPICRTFQSEDILVVTPHDRLEKPNDHPVTDGTTDPEMGGMVPISIRYQPGPGRSQGTLRAG